MPDPDGGARIAFAGKLPAYLQLAEGWLATMAAASEDASPEDEGLEGVLEALHERVAALASLVADAREEYPSIVARCPVAILCTCPSLSALRSIYAATSTLMRDIAYELEVERIRAEQADAPERQVRILNEAAADYSSAASDWDAGVTDLEPVAAALATTPPSRCDRCGVDDVIALAADEGAQPDGGEGAQPDGDEGAQPDGEAPPAAVAAGARGGAAWIATAQDVVAQLTYRPARVLMANARVGSTILVAPAPTTWPGTSLSASGPTSCTVLQWMFATAPCTSTPGPSPRLRLARLATSSRPGIHCCPHRRRSGKRARSRKRC